jgi:hypothetical protein
LLALAVIAHAIGWRWLANIYGDAVFFAALLAVIVVAWRE